MHGAQPVGRGARRVAGGGARPSRRAAAAAGRGGGRAPAAGLARAAGRARARSVLQLELLSEQLRCAGNNGTVPTYWSVMGRVYFIVLEIPTP